MTARRPRAVDGDEHAGRAVERRAPPDVARAPRQRRAVRDERRLAERHVPAVDLALDPGTVLFADVGGEHELEPALARRADDRRREHVRRDLVERGREPQQLVGRRVREHLDVGDLREPRA